MLSIQTLEDADDRDVLLERAPWWAAVFSKLSALYRLETRKRQENLSVKRRTRAKWMRAVREGPESPSIRPKGGTLTTTAAVEASQEDTISGIVLKPWVYAYNQEHSEIRPSSPVVTPRQESTDAKTPSNSQRVPSNASIAAPEKDSAEGPTLFAAREKESDTFANLFCSELIGLLWRKDRLQLDWVRGRRFPPRLVWREG